MADDLIERLRNAAYYRADLVDDQNDPDAVAINEGADEIEALRKRVQELEEFVGKLQDALWRWLPSVVGNDQAADDAFLLAPWMGGDINAPRLGEEIEARAERAEAELAAIKIAPEDPHVLAIANTRLQAELAAAREDAERYRWLRSSRDDAFWACHEKDGYGGQVLKYGVDLDAAIDAARGQG